METNAIMTPEQNANAIIGAIKEIIKFNQIGGNAQGDVNFQLEHKLLKEEIDEYKEAAMLDNSVEIADALGDTFVVLIGTMWKHGLIPKLGQILTSICESNNTKWCTSEEEAKASVEYYKDLGTPTEYTYNEDHKVFVIKSTKGKILKSINFKRPKL